MVLFHWIVGSVVFLIALLLFCTASGKMSPEAKVTAKEFFGLNCAHRGLHTKDQKIPENSLTAFIEAYKCGYGIELDVQLSKDNQAIVFHDFDLKRACGIDELVRNLTWLELSELPLFGTSENIPLLTDVLKVTGDSPIIIELKPTRGSYVKLCEITLDILRKHGASWCIESFDPRIVAWFRKNAPDVLRGQLSSTPKKFEDIPKMAVFFVGHLLTNFMSRPHFIAYRADPHPFTMRFCQLFNPMNVVWTLAPDVDIEYYERRNDTVIFEYYKPTPRYK